MEPLRPLRHSRALGRRWPAATKDLADDLSRSGTRDAGAGHQRDRPRRVRDSKPAHPRRSTKGEYPVKWIKNLALAAIAAAAFMAFLGAGTASATQLCAFAPA